MSSPSSTAGIISERIARLTDLYEECILQITRLSKTSGIGTDVARTELATVIHQSLKEAEQEIEAVNIQIHDLNPVVDPQVALQSQCNRLSGDFKVARQQYRKAQLTAKRDSETTKRQLLFGDKRRNGDGSSRLDNKDRSAEEVVESASSDVTTALRRTHALMAAELNRSQFAAETLASSTNTLKQLTSTYSTFDTLLLRSKSLITGLVRQNKSDQWYYQTSLYCLISTIIYLVIRRLFYGPIRLFIYLPLKYFVFFPLKTVWRMFAFAGWLVLGIGSGGGGSSSANGTAVGIRDTTTAGKQIDHSHGNSINQAQKIAKDMLPEQSVPSIDAMKRQEQAREKGEEEEGQSPPKGQDQLIITDDGDIIRVPLEPIDVDGQEIFSHTNGDDDNNKSPAFEVEANRHSGAINVEEYHDPAANKDQKWQEVPEQLVVHDEL